MLTDESDDEILDRIMGVLAPAHDDEEQLRELHARLDALGIDLEPAAEEPPAEEQLRELHARLDGVEAQLGDATAWGEITEDVSDAPVLAGEIDQLLSAGALEEAAARVMAAQPMLRAHDDQTETRDWQLDFGPASAPAGETLTLFVHPQCLFRGEKVIANDTSALPGTGTRITSITVGNKVQRPMASSTLTAMFAANSLADGITWDTTQKYSTIAVTVSFISACTFDLTVFGKSVL